VHLTNWAGSCRIIESNLGTEYEQERIGYSVARTHKSVPHVCDDPGGRRPRGFRHMLLRRARRDRVLNACKRPSVSAPRCFHPGTRWSLTRRRALLCRRPRPPHVSAEQAGPSGALVSVSVFAVRVCCVCVLCVCVLCVCVTVCLRARAGP
jgi:hypothetical protein